MKFIKQFIQDYDQLKIILLIILLCNEGGICSFYRSFIDNNIQLFNAHITAKSLSI